MLPFKYRNVFSGIKIIVKEEGVRALYKGFLAYSVPVKIYIWMVLFYVFFYFLFKVSVFDAGLDVIK